MSSSSSSGHTRPLDSDAPQLRKQKRRKSSIPGLLHKALKYVAKQKQSKLRRLLSKHEALFNTHALLQDLLHATCTQPSGAPIARMLLRRGARADVCGANGRTPAHVAAAAGCLEVLAVLMAHHTAPDLDAEDATGRTVFAYTAAAMESNNSADTRRVADMGRHAAASQDDGWADKLAGACSDPEQHERYMGGWEDAETPWGKAAAEEPHWTDTVRQEYEAKQRAQRAQHAAAWHQHRQEAAQRRAAAADAAHRNSARILEEEKQRDRAWRDAVAHAGAGTSRQAYQTRWLALVSAPPAQLPAADIPWLVAHGVADAAAALRTIVLHGIPSGDVAMQRRRVREELLRWHPDKFEARFGALLAPAEADNVMLRVKHMSQLLNDLHGQLASTATSQPN